MTEEAKHLTLPAKLREHTSWQASLCLCRHSLEFCHELWENSNLSPVNGERAEEAGEFVQCTHMVTGSDPGWSAHLFTLWCSFAAFDLISFFVKWEVITALKSSCQVSHHTILFLSFLVKGLPHPVFKYNWSLKPEDFLDKYQRYNLFKSMRQFPNDASQWA